MKNFKESLLGSKITKLEVQSQNIVDVFTKTVTDLKSVNSEVEKEAETRAAEIKRLNEEMSNLATIKANNEKVIEKITKIFE